MRKDASSDLLGRCEERNVRVQKGQNRKRECRIYLIRKELRKRMVCKLRRVEDQQHDTRHESDFCLRMLRLGIRVTSFAESCYAESFKMGTRIVRHQFRLL